MQKKAEDAGKTYTQDDHREVCLKRQHKLFGNIEFVGELFTVHLLRHDIAKSIFEWLLHDEQLNDDTVEAAIRFIEKIGQAIEEVIAKQADGAKSRKFTSEEYNSILAKFDHVWKTSEDPNTAPGKRVVSKRI